MMRAGLADSTWIFLGWEGVSAELQGLSLRTFSLQDAGVPYGYSPVLLAHPVLLANEEDKQRLAAFLEATERGFQFAASNPAEAAQILIRASQHPSLASQVGQELATRSQALLSAGGNYLNSSGR
mmetsp:Transcript_3830/g.5255  ORF Transcript_3830/g.5255 Transcript_3830/m.5255 type:complete len:125 (-) Transcript_3830:2040-2414(-)